MGKLQKVFQEFDARNEALLMLFTQFLQSLSKLNESRIIGMLQNASDQIDLHFFSFLFGSFFALNEVLNQVGIQFKDVFFSCFMDTHHIDVLVNELQGLCSNGCPNQGASGVNRLDGLVHL